MRFIAAMLVTFALISISGGCKSRGCSGGSCGAGACHGDSCAPAATHAISDYRLDAQSVDEAAENAGTIHYPTPTHAAPMGSGTRTLQAAPVGQSPFGASTFSGSGSR